MTCAAAAGCSGDIAAEQTVPSIADSAQLSSALRRGSLTSRCKQIMNTPTLHAPGVEGADTSTIGSSHQCTHRANDSHNIMHCSSASQRTFSQHREQQFLLLFAQGCYRSCKQHSQLTVCNSTTANDSLTATRSSQEAQTVNAFSI